MELKKEVFLTISKQKLIKVGDTLVVGVSGGADSIALLHVLYMLKHELAIKIHVAHFNHRLRPTADRDERFVRKLAAQLNLPITVALRKGSSKSVVLSEDKARQLRFEFFVKLARKLKADAIVLAHTQNDLAETVLMRLLRGSGLLGLRGIMEENSISGETFIRPFLSIQRIQIEKYLHTQGLKFCNDETNQQTHYLRNKIRLKLLPALIKDYNSNLPNTLVDLAYSTQDDYDYLLKHAQELFKKKAQVSKTNIIFDLRSFLALHRSMQRMLLRLSYEKLCLNLNQLSFSHIQEVEEMLLNRPEGALVHWPRSVTVLKTKKTLKIGF